MVGRVAAPNLIAQALAPLAGAAIIISGGTSTMFSAPTGIAIVSVILVGILWLVVHGHPADGLPRGISQRLERD